MHKKDLQKVSQPDEPLVEIKIYVEQSVVNSPFTTIHKTDCFSIVFNSIIDDY